MQLPQCPHSKAMSTMLPQPYSIQLLTVWLSRPTSRLVVASVVVTGASRLETARLEDVQVSDRDAIAGTLPGRRWARKRERPELGWDPGEVVH